MKNPDEYYHGMSRMKRDDRTGKAVNSQDLSKEEKTNQTKNRKIEESSNIALVNLRRTIEGKKVEKLQKNLHLVDFERPSQSVQFISSLNELPKAQNDAGMDDQDAGSGANEDQKKIAKLVPRETRDAYVH